MKLSAEEFIDEVNWHNSWQYYPSSKQKVIGWLKQFAEMHLENISKTKTNKNLDDKILQPFRDFVNKKYWEQDNEYICKETGFKEDLDDIVRYWHQEY